MYAYNDIKSNPLKVRYGGGTGTGAPLRWTFFLLEPKLFGYRPGRNYPPGAASRLPEVRTAAGSRGIQCYSPAQSRELRQARTRRTSGHRHSYSAP